MDRIAAKKRKTASHWSDPGEAVTLCNVLTELVTQADTHEKVTCHECRCDILRSLEESGAETPASIAMLKSWGAERGFFGLIRPKRALQP